LFGTPGGNKLFGRHVGRWDNIIKMDVKLLTFRGPCIALYSYDKGQQGALFLNFILAKNFTCFTHNYCPSFAVNTVLRLLVMDSKSVGNM
jgi:hypothetical protein